MSFQAITKDDAAGHLGVIVSAAVLLVALTRTGVKGGENYEYGLALASVAMFLALVGGVAAHYKMGSEQVILGLNGLLFAWCFIGACFMTFDAPFQDTSNGYFASIGLVVCSLMTFGYDAKDAKEAAGNMGGLVGLFAAAIVLFVALVSEDFNDSHSYHGGMVYATVLSALTIVVAGFFLYYQKNNGEPHTFAFYTLLAFMIMWVVAAGFVTFEGPFFATGNGYFSAWGGAFASVFAAMAAKPKTES